MITDFPEIKVMYVKSSSGIAGSSKAFDLLESKLETLKGRKFYGLIFGTPPNEEYYSSVAIAERDNPEAMNFLVTTIPAGKYAQERVLGWHEDTKKIGTAFKKLMEENVVDNLRPCIEYYRSMRDMLVRVPVK